MTREEQLKIYEEVNSKLTKLSKSKGEDYAGEDVLSNFKNLADACKSLQIDITTPVGVSLFFQIHKIARIANLLKSGNNPNNEGIEDSFIDLINYGLLAYSNWLDQDKGWSFDTLKNLKRIDKQPETINGVLNDPVNGKVIQKGFREYVNGKYVDYKAHNDKATLDDAEEWLQNERDIWNHPYISDRTNKNTYELAELLADFVNYWQKTCKND